MSPGSHLPKVKSGAFDNYMLSSYNRKNREPSSERHWQIRSSLEVNQYKTIKQTTKMPFFVGLHETVRWIVQLLLLIIIA